MSLDNREKLLQAGIDLLSRKTFSEISMDLVAEKSGVSKPMIYYYFDNKEGYYKALAGYLLKQARSYMFELFSLEKSLRQNLLDYARFRIDFVEEHPGLSNAFISIITDPNIGTLISEMQPEFEIMRLEFIDPLFDQAEERGEIKKGINRGIVMMMLNSLLVTFTVKLINKMCSVEEIDPKVVVDMIFEGISADREDNQE